MCWLCTFIAGSAIFVVYIGVVAYKQGKYLCKNLEIKEGWELIFKGGSFQEITVLP